MTILTRDSEEHLDAVLNALASFDEVVIYDNGSRDGTLALARRYSNVVIYEGPFAGFGETHNRASALAAHDWIFSVDSDEVVSEALVDEIESLQLERTCVYSVPRRNYFNGKWIRWCGWHPDRQYRLYHRGNTSFNDAAVHEQIDVTSMRHHKLHGHLTHYSYGSLEDFIDKMQLYSTLFARHYCGIRRSSPFKAWCHGAYAFIKSYIIKRGFLGGYEGFIISAYNGHTAFYKYIKLYAANKSCNR